MSPRGITTRESCREALRRRNDCRAADSGYSQGQWGESLTMLNTESTMLFDAD
jgi:hypothetical protein